MIADRALGAGVLGLLLLSGIVEAKQAGGEVQDFKRHIKIENVKKHDAPWIKVSAQDTLLYIGPGMTASVEVIENNKFSGVRFISTLVDGQECARFQVKSLKAPLNLPPIRLSDARGIGTSNNSQSANGKSNTSAKISVPGDPRTYVIYDGVGTGCSSKLIRRGKMEFFSIEVDGEVVYLVPVGLDHEVDLEPDAELTQDVIRRISTKVLVRINEYREKAKLSPVTEDGRLSLGCALHAYYLVKNYGRPETQGEGGHREDPGLPGYSEEGHKAGQHSVVYPWTGTGNVIHHVDGWFATPYHRPPLLTPGLKAVGIGLSRGARGTYALVVDTSASNYVAKPDGPVIYPVPDQTDVPLQFSIGTDGEWPEPRDNPVQKAGYPITLQWPQGLWQPEDSKVRLLANGKEVEFFLSTPEAPRRTVRPQPGVVWILPKEILKTSTTYTVEFQCRQIGIEKTPEWSKTWSFTTTVAP